MRRRLVWPVGPLLLSGKIDTVWPGLSNYLICNDGRFYDDIEYNSTKTVNAGGVFGKIYVDRVALCYAFGSVSDDL